MFVRYNALSLPAVQVGMFSALRNIAIYLLSTSYILLLCEEFSSAFSSSSILDFSMNIVRSRAFDWSLLDQLNVKYHALQIVSTCLYSEAALVKKFDGILCISPGNNLEKLYNEKTTIENNINYLTTPCTTITIRIYRF